MTVIFADSNRARIRYVRSTSGWATIPTSGKTRELRFTGSTINASKDTVISEEIRPDRMVPDVIEVGAKSMGDINGEFSAGTHDDFLEGFMFGAWTRPMTYDQVKGQAISITANNTITIAGVDMSSYFIVGRRIRLDGFVTPANNDIFQVSAIAFGSGATTITTAATTLVVEAGNALASLYDANDTIVLKSTAIRFGTSGASTIDSNGGNAFATANSAGQLVSGQKIFVETTLGYQKATHTYTATPTAHDTVIVNDGVNPAITYEYGGTGSNVNVSLGANLAAALVNITAAINANRHAGLSLVYATASGTVLTLKNIASAGGATSSPVNTSAVDTVVDFTGGSTAIRGIYTVLNVTDDILTVTPQPATNANAASVAVSIKGSMLRNPGDPNNIVVGDFAFETSFTDVGQFFITDGLKLSTFSLEVAAGAITKVAFNMHGRKTIRQSVTKLGDPGVYTPLATTATDVVNATVNVGTIMMNGAALSTALQSVSVTGDNALREQLAVGNKFPAGIGAGRMEIKGAVKAYFADGTLWDHFINHDTVSLGFYIQDHDLHHYEITVPAAKFSTDTVNPSAGNQDVMEDMEYIAKRDPVTQCQIQFDRFSSLSPVTA